MLESQEGAVPPQFLRHTHLTRGRESRRAPRRRLAMQHYEGRKARGGRGKKPACGTGKYITQYGTKATKALALLLPRDWLQLR